MAALTTDVVPERGELLLVASKEHAVSDVVAYVVGATGRADPARTSFVVDASLCVDPGVWRYLLLDREHRRAVEIVYRKWEMMPDPLRSELAAIEEKWEHGTASVAERARYAREMQRMVEILLDDTASRAYIVAQERSFAEVKSRLPGSAHDESD